MACVAAFLLLSLLLLLTPEGRAQQQVVAAAAPPSAGAKPAPTKPAAPRPAAPKAGAGRPPPQAPATAPAVPKAAPKPQPKPGSPAPKPRLPANAAAVAAAAKAAAAKQKQQRAAALAGLPPAIPLPLLLGESKYKNPQLSNDGRYLAYIRPDHKSGIANLFVRPLPERSAAGAASGIALEEVDAAVGVAPRRRRSSGGREVSLFDRDGTERDRQVTFDTDSGVSAYSWAEDGSGIYYIQDDDGDENYHLYSVPVVGDMTGIKVDPIDLTPFPGVKAQGIISNERFPDKIFIGLNARDATVFDMYLLDTKSLTLALHTINPGDVSNWLMDYDFNIRGAECYNNSDGSSYVLINDALPRVTGRARSPRVVAEQEAGKRAKAGATPAKADTRKLQDMFTTAALEEWGQKQWIAASSSRADVSKWRRLITWPFGEEGGVFRFNKAGTGLYIITSMGRDTTEFQLISTAPGTKVLQRIASNRLANVGPVEFHPQEWFPQMVSFNYLQVQWSVLDPNLKAEWARIQAFRPGEEVNIVDRSTDQRVWILGYSGDSPNNRFYLHHPGTWPPQLLFDSQPGLAPYTTARMHPVVIPARDGLPLPSYLTLPVMPRVPQTSLPPCVVGAVPDLAGAARAAAVRTPGGAKAAACPMALKLPLVLAVHGGPWSRDTWGSDSVVQFLANRGYAVLQVNYRGSSGYGKNFTNLGDRQWGIGFMQHDLTDAVRWAVEKGIADAKRVCIMGGSYGGYATLAGLAFTPELYACGVDLVGISNVATFMKSIPPYWKPLHYEWLTRVGNAPKDPKLNRAISPLFHVNKIRAPLFIAQGANDPRVPQAESDQMYRAMKAKGLDVQYVLYPDEGHGLNKADNREDYYSRVEQFLARHIGGRAEPQLVVPGASAKVITSVADLAPPGAAKHGGQPVHEPLASGGKKGGGGRARARASS